MTDREHVTHQKIYGGKIVVKVTYDDEQSATMSRLKMKLEDWQPGAPYWDKLIKKVTIWTEEDLG